MLGTNVGVISRREGFWPMSPKETGFPVADGWSTAEAQAFMADLDVVESHLTALNSFDSYRGFSSCRLCQCPNGSLEYKHQGWVWPQGLIHYIEAHRLKPTGDFIEFIVGEAADIRDRFPLGTPTTQTAAQFLR